MSERKRARHETILLELNRGANLRVADLAKEFGVSTETIRRDLDALTKTGRIDRIYGGATRPIGFEPGLTERHKLFAAERERIARSACEIVKDGQILMIGSGATTAHVARRIAAQRRDLTIFTHSYNVAAAMADNSSIQVIMVPGSYLGEEKAVIGSLAITFLARFSGDIAILGASGLTMEGANEALVDTAAVYSLMAERCASCMIVADHSKVDRVFPVCFRSWEGINYLVTDQHLQGRLAERVRSRGVDVVVP